MNTREDSVVIKWNGESLPKSGGPTKAPLLSPLVDTQAPGVVADLKYVRPKGYKLTIGSCGVETNYENID